MLQIHPTYQHQNYSLNTSYHTDYENKYRILLSSSNYILLSCAQIFYYCLLKTPVNYFFFETKKTLQPIFKNQQLQVKTDNQSNVRWIFRQNFILWLLLYKDKSIYSYFFTHDSLHFNCISTQICVIFLKLLNPTFFNRLYIFLVWLTSTP